MDGTKKLVSIPKKIFLDQAVIMSTHMFRREDCLHRSSAVIIITDELSAKYLHENSKNGLFNPENFTF